MLGASANLLMQMNHEAISHVTPEVTSLEHMPTVDGRGVLPGVASLVVDATSLEFFSAGWSQLIGASSEPASLTEWVQSIHVGDRQRVQQVLDNSCSSLNPHTFDLECRTEVGSRTIRLRGQLASTVAADRRLLIVAYDLAMLGGPPLVNTPGHVDGNTLADIAPTMMWSTDATGRSEWFNRRWLEFTGQSLQQALVGGRNGAIHPEDRTSVMSAFKAAFQQRDAIELEYRMHAHNIGWRWISERSTPRFSANGELLGYVGVCSDVTQEYHYRRRLYDRESVLQQLNDIGERERTYLSCAIHDGILQDIIGADMLMQNSEKLDEEALAKRLQRTRETLNSAISHGRKLISELRPMILDEQGIVSAIEFYAAEIENRSPLKFKVACEECPDIASTFWGCNVFRIVQEAMNNVEAHSGVESASVHLSVSDRQFRAVIRDEGDGFDVSSQTDSFGLKCMRERAEIFSGALEINSQPGEGCCITLQVPIPASVS